GTLVSGGRAGQRIDVRAFADRPRLAVVARDGDPLGAVVVTFVTGAPPATTTALAALVEARLRAVGVDVDTRASRGAFRVRWTGRDAAKMRALFDAITREIARPVAAGAAELALVEQRVTSLERHPLDAPELAPIAACTGALAVAPGEAAIDVKTAAGVAELEAARRALGADRAAVGVVGDSTFVAAAASSLQRSAAWPVGASTASAAPMSESVGAYASTAIDKKSARLTVAVAVADPAAAAAAAEALGADDAVLAARVRGLAEPWRVASVTGAARPHGGCVSVVLEGDARSSGGSLEASAALAGAITRKEIALALAAPTDAGDVAARAVVEAADPREAAARAAWWTLATRADGKDTWAVALGVPPTDKGAVADGLAVRLRERLAASIASSNAQTAERRVAVERGQGELWLLLASPCGVAEEGARDAGVGALAALAAVEPSRRDRADVRLEAWITADGIGVLAHAAPQGAEAPSALAARVAGAASRALFAGTSGSDATFEARAELLDRIERESGRQGAAFEALANALAPNHPSWVAPLGLWSRVASSGVEAVRLRAAALAAGPMRVAVLANVDQAEADAAVAEVDRWLAPSAGERACRPGVAAPSRAGTSSARLPSDAQLGQALVAVPLPDAGRAYAEAAAAILGGERGPLAGALKDTAPAWSARVVGGARGAALVVDVRAPDDSLASATAQARATLLNLGERVTDADVARANADLARADADASLDPRSRVAALWSGASGPRRVVTTSALKAYLGAWIRESSLVVVEARAD
ncbi:MAG TPA: hypothetical protein VGM56_10620, partial [Byssovorax sp.]